MKFVVIGCLCAGALVAVGCADGGSVPTSPSAIPAVSGLAATAPGNEGTTRPAVSPSLSASPRSGDLHVTKECSGYTGGAGSFCMITSSNVKAIEVGSRILYLQPDQLFTPSGSDVVLDPSMTDRSVLCQFRDNAAGGARLNTSDGMTIVFQP